MNIYSPKTLTGNQTLVNNSIAIFEVKKVKFGHYSMAESNQILRGIDSGLELNDLLFQSTEIPGQVVKLSTSGRLAALLRDASC